MIEHLLVYDEVTVSMLGDYVHLTWFSEKLEDTVQVAFHEKDWQIIAAVIDELRFPYGH